MFKDYVKKLREKKKMSLRAYCKDNNIDISMWSKVERGMLPPTANRDILKRVAAYSDLGSKEQRNLFDLACIERRVIPPDIELSKEIVKKLLLFFEKIERKEIPKKKSIRERALDAYKEKIGTKVLQKKKEIFTEDYLDLCSIDTPTKEEIETAFDDALAREAGLSK